MEVNEASHVTQREEDEATHGAKSQQEFETFQPKAVLENVKSVVWQFFIFRGAKGKGPDKNRVYCRLCPNDKMSSKNKKQPGIPYSGGTSNLSAHLKFHHPKEFLKAESEEKTKTKKYNDSDSNTVESYFAASKKQYKWPKGSPRWKEMTMAIAKWFCKDSRSSLMVEDEGFKRVMELAAPEYDMPCAKTISTYIQTLYEEEKKKIMECLKEPEHMALTSDGGTSSNAVSFQATNVHFIDADINLKYFCLGVRENKEKHTADNYRAKTEEIKEEFEIEEKVFMNVTDNEAKMQKAFEKKERNGCMSHIIHKTVTAGADGVKEVKDILVKIRKIAGRHNKSYAFRYGLNVEQQKMGIKTKVLHQDVPTRWGSTRASTESFLDSKEDEGEETEQSFFGELESFKNAEAINNALKKLKWKKKIKLSYFLLSTSDMMRIRNISKFLTRIDIFCTTLGGSKFVSSSVVLPVVKSFKKLLEPDEDDVSYIAKIKRIMCDDFKARIAENLNFELLIKASALDPRFSRLKIVDKKEKREEVFDTLLKEMKNLKSEKTEEKEEQTEKKRKLALDFDESDDEEGEDQDEMKREVGGLIIIFKFQNHFIIKLYEN
jgi:hypothetical protein